MKSVDLLSDTDLDEGLLQLWTDHLNREEALLDATVHSLRQVRTAIMNADFNRLPNLLAFQDNLALDADPIARARESLRETLAPYLGVSPVEVTLRRATAWLQSTYGINHLVGCERLVQRLHEAETLRCTIVTLIRSSLAFYQKLLGSLAGGTSPDRYGPGGKWQGSASGSLIQGRG